MMAAPKIRFKGFTDAWVERKLGEVARFRDGERKPLESGDRANRQGEYPYYGASGIIDYIDDYIFDDTLILLGEDGANIINRSTPLAFIAEGKYWVNNHAHVIEPLSENDIRFVCEALEQIDYTIYNTGTAQPKLNQEVCHKIPFFVTGKPEQTAIGNFFRTLDDAITLHKHKLDGLKELKKGYLQQMFPQAGERVPRVRFSGFSEDWEQRKLGELVTPIVREVAKPNEPYWRLSVRSHVKGTFKQFVDDPAKIAMGKLYIVKENDLIVNITFAWEHAIAIATKEDDGLLVSHRFPTFLIDKSNKDFLLCLVSSESFRKKLELISPGGAGRNRVLNKNDFMALIEIVPSIAEQTTIGNFFRNIDEQIAAQTEKVEQLRRLKAGYLQGMFV